MKRYWEQAGSLAVLAGAVSTLFVAGIVAKESIGRQPALEARSAENAENASLAEDPILVCSDFLEEDGNSFAMRMKGNIQPVECAFVGCAGLF